jgi:hypothetical protein
MKEKTYTACEAIMTAITMPIISVAAWIIFFPLTILYAWCDRFLWNWFAAPYFHLTPMSLWTAVAIGLWIGLQTMDVKVVKDEQVKAFTCMAITFSLHVLGLATAYIIHTRWQP